MEIQQELLNALDIDYSYRLAKKMEQFRTHPELGYRTSGSRAEFQTGEMLKEEMERIGLCSVTKDPVTTDGWEFKKALLSYTALDGEKRSVLLGAYIHFCVGARVRRRITKAETYRENWFW